MKKVLVLGSGGLQVGQAGEFDYSGSQAIKALREEGIQTVLINPNIATYQTSEGMADTVYFLPVTPEMVEKIIEKERPDGIFLQFGGQTALNCAVKLKERGTLEKYAVRVLGTPIEAIEATEDRDIFKEKLDEIDVPTAPSTAASTLPDALDAAGKIGYPVICRAAYALGGLGSGFADTQEELATLCATALTLSPQVLIEKSLRGWKEVEYEMVRDANDNCIAVCNMENIDPLGVHTGDSIVVAPSQTLTNKEYHMLRDRAIRVIRHLGIIGECNIQYALSPHNDEYYVIEVNARLSRSSALASKATGYPLAYVAAKLALGKSLIDVKNPVTGQTVACFEPALDYCVLKIPRWDLKKFSRARTKLGSSMKSVGEVMSIGRSFEEAVQKAIRMTETGLLGLVGNDVEMQNDLDRPDERRLLAVAQAIQEGRSLDDIYEESMIDKWFLYKLANIVSTAEELKKGDLDETLLRTAKQQGFSDEQIEKLSEQEGIREKRKHLGILPIVKQIDTLAAEWPSQTNYLYITYNGTEHDIQFDAKKNVITLGGGSYRIGSSVEFDWCCMNCVNTLKGNGYTTTVINCNPETVSTDYDMSDRLYFEELSAERVLDIIDLENPEGVVVSMGGQTPNNLTPSLASAGVPILGTDPDNIDRCENRDRFSSMLDSLGVGQPDWVAASTLKEAESFAEKVGYPVLIRPSYVLSGAAMRVVSEREELDRCLKEATRVSREYPVVISKFIENAKEIEMDCVADSGELLAYAISEHIEHAGVHSGDATLVLPAQKLWLETVRKIKRATREIARELKITGPFNIQYIAKNNEIKVIECNLRCSRTFPFVSKVFGVNFIQIATEAMLGLKPRKVDKSLFDLDYVGVKAPQFSFTRLTGADPVLGVEMASTGEVACLGEHVEDAFLQALLSTGFAVPKKNILLSTGPVQDKADFMESARKLESLGYTLYATPGTGKFLREHGVECETLYWPLSEKNPNIEDYLKAGNIDLVVNIPKSLEREEITNDYIIRRTAVDMNIPLITNLDAAILFVRSLVHASREKHEPKSWKEFVKI